ncbi:MAG: FHA domain-containing protein [Anaerolineae bacterium]|nr:FHA domain-containing protein [Anaerolineae bacterium]
MKRSFRQTIRWLISIISLLAITTGVLAQSQGQIRIDLVSTVENAESMELKVYFNLYDPASGLPLTASSPASAEISLLTTDLTTPAVIAKPDLPIYITLVLDASGSMAGNAQKLRDAAKMALSNPPDDAYFGVVQFDEGTLLLQDFTENLQLVNYAIDQYKTSNKATCLYDAAYAAVEAQAQAPVGRRAVIVFTDGKDEGQDGKPCSQKSLTELTAKAIELKVPLHTIGLLSTSGNINETELRNMAGTTGGYSAMSNVDELPAAFSRIMEALKTQMVLISTIYPVKGQNQAVMTVTLQDKTILNAAFFLNSETDYPGPPSPVSMRFDGLRLVAETQTYDLQLALTSPDLVGYIKVALWDMDSGSKVNDYQFNDPGDFNTFSLPTDQMTADRKYELRISAISREDNTAFVIATSDRGEQTTELVHEFSFDPSSIYPGAVIDSVSQEGTDLVLAVSLTNPNQISSFDGWLVDEETKTQVKNSNFSIPFSAASSGRLVLETRDSRLPSGKYAVVLRLLNAENEVMSSTQYDGVVFRAPGLIQRIVAAVTAKPIFLVIIAAIVLLLVVFLMISSARQKSVSATPVMQGQLGKKMKGKNTPDGYQAIASDEAVLAKLDNPVVPVPGEYSMPAAAPKPPAKPAVDATVMMNQAGTPAPTVTAPTPAAPQKAFLTATRGMSGSWTVDQLPYVIGRTEGNLVLDEKSISRRHVQIQRDAAGRETITDLNSSNGTRLNGVRLVPGQATALPVGALIDLGPNVTLRFEKR